MVKQLTPVFSVCIQMAAEREKVDEKPRVPVPANDKIYRRLAPHGFGEFSTILL